MKHQITDINQMTQVEFVETFGGVFEETPQIAEDVWHHRPFTDIQDLHQKMVHIVIGLSDTDQLQLIQMHPDLGGRVKMTASSVQEQTGVGLHQLNALEYEHFKELNRAYRQKFDFPFVIAVKDHTKSSILEAFDRRLNQSKASEIQQALFEIAQIARFRLESLVG